MLRTTYKQIYSIAALHYGRVTLKYIEAQLYIAVHVYTCNNYHNIWFMLHIIFLISLALLYLCKMFGFASLIQTSSFTYLSTFSVDLSQSCSDTGGSTVAICIYILLQTPHIVIYATIETLI